MPQLGMIYLSHYIFKWQIIELKPEFLLLYYDTVALLCPDDIGRTHSLNAAENGNFLDFL